MKKNFILLVLGLFLMACESASVPAVFKDPTVEALSVFSISETEAEMSADISEVYQTVAEVGVVWAEQANPTISNKSLTLQNIKADQLLAFKIPNLQKGKTYFFRTYYRIGDKTTYSNEINTVQNYTGDWQRLESPKLSADDYIYNETVIIESQSGAFTMTVTKINRFTNEAVFQVYVPSFNAWNPAFRGQDFQNAKPFPALFNPIRAQFVTNGQPPLTLFGAGYQIKPRGGRFYLRNMYILESTGSWEAYPGAEATNTSFGIEDYVYVLENLPNGHLWRFDFSMLKWKNLGAFPYNKPARFVGFDVGERAFVLIEPVDIQGNSNELYEYLPNENRWARRANFTGENRRKGANFIINNRAYFGLGQTPTSGKGLRDIWEYDPIKDAWRKAADYPGTGTIEVLAEGSGNGAFIGFGQQVRNTAVGGEDYRTATDFWFFRRK